MSEQPFETLDEQQCQHLLASKDIGRIAFSVQGEPEIFPVNYAADGSTVVFRTGEGTKLQLAVCCGSHSRSMIGMPRQALGGAS